LQLLALGAFIGASLGLLACWSLSGGRAAGRFYVIYGCFGAAIGVFGSIVGGAIIGMMRFATRITSRRPQSAARDIASDNQPGGEPPRPA